MKLKEAPVSIAFSENARIHILKEPVFDLSLARTARESSNQLVREQFGDGNSTLELAIALGMYNFMLAAQDDPQNNGYEPRNRYELDRLIRRETRASGSPLLPTIGFEVESPRKPFTANGQGTVNNNKYLAFSQAIGFPKNSASSDSMWEFAPDPSYSASVQAYILNQLIKGGLIPSLSDSKNPHDIRRYLDNKLVSLHVNIGLPSSARVDKEDDFKLFNEIFAVAYTSPTRFLRKANALYNIQKSTEAVHMPNGYGEGGRFEIKDVEVRDESVYRLFEEIQLLSACMLASIGEYEKPAAQIWDSLRAEAESILLAKEESILVRERRFSRANVLIERLRLARMAMDGQLVLSLRTLIARAAREAKDKVLLDMDSNHNLPAGRQVNGSPPARA